MGKPVPDARISRDYIYTHSRVLLPILFTTARQWHCGYTYVDGEVLVGEKEEALETVVEATKHRISEDLEHTTVDGGRRHVSQGQNGVHDESITQRIDGRRAGG